MSEEIERWRCSRCDVTYRIEETPGEKAERLTCSDCGKPFWCAKIQKTVVTMGMETRPA